MNFSLSTYSRDGRVVDIYFTKLTKLDSNKEKANIALIWDIISHYCNAKIIFSVHGFTRFYDSQILILWSSDRKLCGWWGSPLHDRTYGHWPSHTSLESP